MHFPGKYLVRASNSLRVTFSDLHQRTPCLPWMDTSCLQRPDADRMLGLPPTYMGMRLDKEDCGGLIKSSSVGPSPIPTDCKTAVPWQTCRRAAIWWSLTRACSLAVDPAARPVTHLRESPGGTKTSCGSVGAHLRLHFTRLRVGNQRRSGKAVGRQPIGVPSCLRVHQAP